MNVVRAMRFRAVGDARGRSAIWGAVLLGVLGVALPAVAAPSPWERADEHYRAERWAEAERAFDALVRSDAEDGEAWLRLAIARDRLGNLAGAVLAYERAGALGVRSFVMLGDAAVAYARLGNHDKAFEWLDRLAREAGPTPDFLAGLEGLESLRNDPRYDLLMERLVRAQHLCSGDEYHALDFWVGTWEVRDQRGQVVGTNRIERTLGSCALVENWRSWTGREGKSFNFYDSSREVWRQIWVGDWGGVLDQSGRVREDGALEFLVEIPTGGGETELSRTTLVRLDDGRVRQTIESSSDGGTNWELTTDFYYVRKE